MTITIVYVVVVRDTRSEVDAWLAAPRAVARCTMLVVTAWAPVVLVAACPPTLQLGKRNLQHAHERRHGNGSVSVHARCKRTIHDLAALRGKDGAA